MRSDSLNYPCPGRRNDIPWRTEESNETPGYQLCDFEKVASPLWASIFSFLIFIPLSIFIVYWLSARCHLRGLGLGRNKTGKVSVFTLLMAGESPDLQGCPDEGCGDHFVNGHVFTAWSLLLTVEGPHLIIWEAPFFFPTVKPAWKVSLMPPGSGIWVPHLPRLQWLTMLEGGTVLHLLFTFQLCLPKMLWGLTGKHPYSSSKGPVNQKLESKKVNVDSTHLEGTADGTSLRNTKHFLQAW